MHKETFISIMRWAYLVSWCFAFLGFTDTTFLQTRAVATLCWACQFMPFLQQLLLTSVSHFGDWNDFLLIIFYGDLWLVIFYITVVIFSGCHKLLPYKTANLINVVCGLTAPLTSHPPVSLPLLRPPYSLRQMILKLGQLITFQWPLSVQVKESHISHFK